MEKPYRELSKTDQKYVQLCAKSLQMATTAKMKADKAFEDSFASELDLFDKLLDEISKEEEQESG